MHPYVKNALIATAFIALIAAAIAFFPLPSNAAEPTATLKIDIPEIKVLEDKVDRLTARADALEQGRAEDQADILQAIADLQDSISGMTIVVPDPVTEPPKKNDPDPVTEPKPKPPVTITPGRGDWLDSRVPRPGASYGVTIDGVPLAASLVLDPWIDGTQISASPIDGGFYVMVWEHPDHVRVSVGLGGRLLRVSDGGKPIQHDPVVICLRIDRVQQECADLDGFTSGQEISFHVGHRAWTRTPQDIIAMGLWPRMEVAKRHVYDYFERTLSQEVQPVPEIPFDYTQFNTPDRYEPLKTGPLRAKMRAQADHQAMHSTRGFAHLALWPEGEYAETAARNMFTSAEAMAVYPWTLLSKGTHKPIDLAGQYYIGEWFGGDFERAPGNLDDHDEASEGEGATFDAAHLYAPWEMYLINGDPYYLRLWQMAVLSVILIENPEWRAQGFADGVPRAVINRQQPRSYGKHLMLTLRLAKVMPDGDWNWLQPKALFDTILANSAEQSQWTAQQPGAINGDIPRSWTGGNNVYKLGVNHTIMQGLWGLGWAVHLGYDGFGDLFQTVSAAVFKQWDAFGVGMRDVGIGLNKTKIRDLEEGIAWGRERYDYDGVAAKFSNFAWEEERFTAITSSLSIWHGGKWEEMAQAMIKERNDFELHYLAKANKNRLPDTLPVDYGLDLSREMRKLQSPIPDWMMALE